MTDVQFNEEAGRRSSFSRPVSSAGFSQFVMKAGVAKTEQGAERVLIGVAIFAALLGGVIWLLLGSDSGKGRVLTPEEGQRAFEAANREYVNVR
jgi:hypothetical protein